MYIVVSKKKQQQRSVKLNVKPGIQKNYNSWSKVYVGEHYNVPGTKIKSMTTVIIIRPLKHFVLIV